jgi:hypothetical protein
MEMLGFHRHFRQIRLSYALLVPLVHELIERFEWRIRPHSDGS